MSFNLQNNETFGFAVKGRSHVKKKNGKKRGHCPLLVGVSDTQIDSIQYLNFAKKLFNSIFNSIVFHENSIQKMI